MSAYNCSEGLILPLIDESSWPNGLRAVLYLAGLLYSFLGVAIAADVFMCAIERITSATRKIKLSPDNPASVEAADDASDVVLFQEVRIWNPTVANLSLMALGSSAPEILLSIIEIVGNGFKAGALGPGTIVGSAAFNLLCITAICIMSIPGGETRRIEAFKDVALEVFCVTAFFSIFAYIWLLIILVGNTKNRVDIWEAFMTLFWFVVLVVLAYCADRNFFMKKKRPEKRQSIEDKSVAKDKQQRKEDESVVQDAEENLALQAGEFDRHKHRRELERDFALRFPHLTPDDLARMVAWRLKQEEPHDRLYYRIRSVRLMSRSLRSDEYWDPSMRQPTSGVSAAPSAVGSIATIPGAPSRKILEFDTKRYGVTAGASTVRLRVRRRGRNNRKILFHWQTVPGSAKKSDHFLHRAESVVMEAGESEKLLTVDLVQGATWEDGDTFYVRLSTEDEKTELGGANPAEIVYVDASQPTSIAFVHRHKSVKESAGFVRLDVRRSGNLAIRQTVTWDTADVTALSGQDYEGGSGELEFEPGEETKYIDIAIIDDMYEEYAETFDVSLSSKEPGVIGKKSKCTVTITCDDGATRYFRQMDQLVPSFMAYLTPGGKDWKQQLLQAASVNAGDLESATITDILLHILCFPFKVVFAMVPPPGIAGGWLTFFIALALIGLLTAVVGDLANIFGCLIGLKPEVTAITFVALGTSLPDTFASRVAAVQEKTADNSVGNVTGSNGVNVFLGLGIPWLIAAIYWETKGLAFEVKAGSLAFSVMLYTICAVLAVALLMVRRFLPVFGSAELGGPFAPKMASGVALIFLWFFYVLFSSLQAYDHIGGF